MIYIARNYSYWPTFLSLHVRVYLHSNLCSGLQKRHRFFAGLRFGRSRSFRVIQGRWFWYQSKARIRLPISRSLWLASYLEPFSRYGDLLAFVRMDPVNIPAKFEVRSFIRSWDNRGYSKIWAAHAPFSPKFLIGFCSNGPLNISAKFDVRIALPIPEIIGVLQKVGESLDSPTLSILPNF